MDLTWMLQRACAFLAGRSSGTTAHWPHPTGKSGSKSRWPSPLGCNMSTDGGQTTSGAEAYLWTGLQVARRDA